MTSSLSGLKPVTFSAGFQRLLPNPLEPAGADPLAWEGLKFTTRSSRVEPSFFALIGPLSGNFNGWPGVLSGVSGGITPSPDEERTDQE
jgi:hypothetical protein